LIGSVGAACSELGFYAIATCPFVAKFVVCYRQGTPTEYLMIDHGQHNNK